MSKFKPRRLVSSFTQYDSAVIYTNSRPGFPVTRNRMRNQKLEWSALKGGLVPGGVALPAIGGLSGTTPAPLPRQFKCSEWAFTCEPARDGHWDADNPAKESLDDNIGANPVMNYRFNAEITDPNGAVHNVPGFYAGDGAGAGEGNVWKFRYAPSATGNHDVDIRFEWHSDLATYKCFNVEPLTTNGTHTPWPHGYSFSFTTLAKNATNLGYFASGHLQDKSKRYLQFQEGTNNYFVKGGMNSPENFLGYAGFDGTVDYGDGNGNTSILHTYSNHEDDWETGDPEWGTGIGSSGIIGAVNWLAGSGCNSIYLMPNTLFGDARDTSPYAYGASDPLKGDYWPPNYNLQYMWDISKLEQWSDFFEHCQEKDIALHLMLAEREPKNVQYHDDPDGWVAAGVSQADNTEGGFGVMRRLYYKQLFAWFGCLPAIQWSLCEEQSASGYTGGNDPGPEYPLSAIVSAGSYLRDLDFYGHSIGLYSDLDQLDLLNNVTNADHWEDTSGWLGHFAIQYTPNASKEIDDLSGGMFYLTSANQILAAASPTKRIVLELDEQGPANGWNGADQNRQRTIWPAYLTSGVCEFYIGGLDANGVSYDQGLDDFTGETLESSYQDISGINNHGRYARDLMISAGNYWDFVNHTATSSVSAILDSPAPKFPKPILAGDTTTSSFITYYPAPTSTPGTLELSTTLGIGDGTLNYYWYNPREGTFDTTGTITCPTLWTVPAPSTKVGKDWALLIKP